MERWVFLVRNVQEEPEALHPNIFIPQLQALALVIQLTSKVYQLKPRAERKNEVLQVKISSY